MNEIHHNKKWTHAITEFLPSEGEVRLVLNRDRTSIEITTEAGNSIELVPSKTGDLEIYKEGKHQTTILKKEFINKISKKLEKKFNFRIDKKNFDDRSILAALLKMRSLLDKTKGRKLEDEKTSPVKPNY